MTDTFARIFYRLQLLIARRPTARRSDSAAPATRLTA